MAGLTIIFTGHLRPTRATTKQARPRAQPAPDPAAPRPPCAMGSAAAVPERAGCLHMASRRCPLGVPPRAWPGARPAAHLG
jgi:hypothetical protein